MRSTVLLLTALLVSCAVRQQPMPAPTKRVPVAVPDVEASNLPPEEEIDALLLGEAALGRGSNTKRIAVAAFRVVGKLETWLGEAAAEVVATGLSRVDGVSVVERAELDKVIAEVKLGADAGSITKSAQGLLGAENLVLGSLTPNNAGGARVAVRAVRVSDGVVLGAFAFEQSGGDWGAADAAVGKLAAALGVGAGAPTPPPLPAAKLGEASRARELQSAGRLLEAYPLYLRALDVPSSAWRLESDYMRLMNDLGMREWVESRAGKLLERMPITGETSCDRAHILVQKSRATVAIRDAREAVRAAASCGDDALTAVALAAFTHAAIEVDAPLSRAAAARASQIASRPTIGAYARCEVEFAAFWAASQEGSYDSDRDERWAGIQQRCSAAGNLRIASRAAELAATSSYSPSVRKQRLSTAYELAKPVGGEQLDAVTIQLAKEERAAGRVADADDRLLEVLGYRLREIARLHGGALPDPEQRLDHELLERAKLVVKDVPATPPSSDDRLLLQVHRRALARGLREWAEQTRKESKKQGDFYGDIAGLLDPSEGSGDEARYLARLEAAKLPLDRIKTTTTTPLRAAGHKANAAFYTLWDWYFALRATKDTAKRREIVAAATKLATWTQSERAAWNAVRLEALLATDEGRAEDALGLARSVEATGRKKNYVWGKLGLDNVIEIRERLAPQLALAACEARITFAKRTSPIDLVWATNAAAVHARKADGDYARAARRMVQLADALEQEGNFEAAALALERAAAFENEGQHAPGTPQAIAYYARRAELLGRLGDPIRALAAKGNLLVAYGQHFFHLYRDNKRFKLRDDPAATAVAADVAERARALAKSGRRRDAARVVISLERDARGVSVLIGEALEWAKAFEDSVEYPALAGRLHAMRGWTLDDFKKRAADLRLAADLQLRAKNPLEATYQFRKAMSFEPSEAIVWKTWDRCIEASGGEKLLEMDCVTGVGEWLARNPRFVLAEPNRLRAAVEHGLGLLEALDACSWPTDLKVYARTYLAIAAVRSGATVSFNKLHDHVRTTALGNEPDAYMWSTHLGRVAAAVGSAAPKIALALDREFDASKGASPYWRGKYYWDAAIHARNAGDAEAERYFLTKGRPLAESSARDYVPYYELCALPSAVTKRNWKLVDKIYGDADAALIKWTPKSVWWAKELMVSRALARAFGTDLAGASKLLAPVVAEADTAPSDGQPAAPALYTRALEVKAAVDAAAGDCKGAEAARARAAAMRARAIERTCQETWCDEPQWSEWKSSNACGKPVSVQPELLSSP